MGVRWLSHIGTLYQVTYWLSRKEERPSLQTAIIRLLSESVRKAAQLAAPAPCSECRC